MEQFILIEGGKFDGYLLTKYEFPGDEIPIIRGSALKALEGDKEYEQKILDLMKAVDDYIPDPKRETDKPFLMPVEDVFSIKGRGTVVTGKVELGVLKVNEGIEIVGIQFERQEDSAYVKKVFNRFRKYYGIEYSLLLGGLADKQAVVEALPQLENFISFPTTVFVDKHGKVKKIHTGFSGPATGKHYTKFINDFNAEVDELLKWWFSTFNNIF